MANSDFDQETLLTAGDIEHKLRRIAHEILERSPDDRPLAIVGIQTRGVPLADRIRAIIASQRQVLTGTLDISLYRDDLDNLGTIPSIKGSDIPFEADGCHIVLVDDVLFTGRTIRAALDALLDYGRPACVELAALVDRGNRELPIAASYLGHEVHTTREDYVKVRLAETDPDEPEAALLLRRRGGKD